MSRSLPPYRYVSHVEQREGVRSGSPCVAGTGIRAVYPARLVLEAGQAPEQVAADLDLELADVYAAVAFYLDNREAMEAEEAQREALAESLRHDLPQSRSA